MLLLQPSYANLRKFFQYKFTVKQNTTLFLFHCLHNVIFYQIFHLRGRKIHFWDIFKCNTIPACCISMWMLLFFYLLRVIFNQINLGLINRQCHILYCWQHGSSLNNSLQADGFFSEIKKHNLLHSRLGGGIKLKKN